MLLGVAVATSHLASSLRSHIDIAQRSARANAVLAGFARRLSGLGTVKEIAGALVEEIETAFDARTTFLRKGSKGLVPVQGAPPLELSVIDTAAAEWAEAQGQPAGIGTQTLTASDWLFQPLKAGQTTLGVVGVISRTGGTPIRGDQMPLHLGLLDQATLALERERLSGEARQVDVLRERDRLRSTLLSSVGHDLRTPLAAVRGAISELRHRPVSELIDTLESESQRLELFFENLLDMTRIEAGAVEVGAEPVDLIDAIAQAVHDMRRQLHGRRIDLDVAVDLPLVTVDPRLFHHCLINLIGNAAKFSREDGPIAFRAMRRPGSLTLAIEDEAVGLLPGEEMRVFDTFRQLAGSDRSGGSGLGFAIVKGFAEAMGITVSAANRHGLPGARFELTFPERLLVRASVEP